MKTKLQRLLFAAPLVCLCAVSSLAQSKPETKPKAPTPADASESYPLDVGDKVQLQIKEDPRPQPNRRELTVTAQGFLFVPISQGYEARERFIAKGKTTQQLQREIKTLMEEKYYHTATVDVQLMDLNLRPGRIWFVGDLIKGSQQLVPGEKLTLTQAIIRQSPNEYANLKKVKVKRENVETGEMVVFEINVQEIMDKGTRENDLILQDGDWIEIPEKSWVW